MSTGAELAVIAAPVAGVAVVATAGLFLAVGVVAVGGVALIGVGRVGVAAGAYVADRLRERAQLCAGEYARFQQLRMNTLASHTKQEQPHKRMTRAATPAPAAGHTYHENPQLDAQIMAHLSADLSAQQQRYAEHMLLIERRAQLTAALALDADRLPADMVERARQNVAHGDGAAITESIAAVCAAVAQVEGQALRAERAALRAQHVEAAGLLAVVSDARLRDKLLDWQIQINRVISSTDIVAIGNRLRTGADLLASCREQHEAAVIERRVEELASVRGLLYAVGGLFEDLRSLEQADLLKGDGAQITRLQELGARYERLEVDTTIALPMLRTEAGRLLAELRTLEQDGLRQLNAFYQQRLANEIEQSMHEMQLDDAPFDRIERSISTDGTVTLKARQGRRQLNLRIYSDARIKYSARGFGDEGCLKAVYGLIDRLIDHGVQIESHHPELTHQVDVALRVIEAIKELGHYPEEQITVSEDATAFVIEAGAGFQRVSVDEQGNIREASERSIVTTAAFTEAAKAVQKKVSKVREEAAVHAAQNRKQHI